VLSEDQIHILEEITKQTYWGNIPPFKLELSGDAVEVYWDVDSSYMSALVYPDGAVWWWWLPNKMQSYQEYKEPMEAYNTRYFRVPSKVIQILCKMGNAYTGEIIRPTLEERLEVLYSSSNRIAQVQ